MQWHFGPFRLDLANACLWHAEQSVRLRPKTFAMLVYLVTHAGQLVTKEALIDAVWPETVVGDGVLKTSMTELRKALRSMPDLARGWTLWIYKKPRRCWRSWRDGPAGCLSLRLYCGDRLKVRATYALMA